MSELVQLEMRRSPHIHRSIDNTAMASYMECPRKYMYSMFLNRRRGGLTRPPLAYGTAWHAGLETHYKTGGDRTAVVRAIIMAWQPHDSPEDHRTPERCIAAYDAFIREYGEHDAETKAWGKTVGFAEGNPVVEIATELWWPGALHPYAGKIDRIFAHQGLFYVEDHKTSSQLGDQYFRQFDPSNQMMGYAVLAGKLTGYPIAGVRVNAHGVLKTQNKFKRATIMFSPERLREWESNYNRWIERIEMSSRLMLERGESVTGVTEQDAAADAFPHNFNACTAKYGQCTYIDVCTSPARIRPHILEHDFEDNPWDPMAPEEDAADA